MGFGLGGHCLEYRSCLSIEFNEGMALGLAQILHSTVSVSLKVLPGHSQ